MVPHPCGHRPQQRDGLGAQRDDLEEHCLPAAAGRDRHRLGRHLRQRFFRGPLLQRPQRPQRLHPLLDRQRGGLCGLLRGAGRPAGHHHQDLRHRSVQRGYAGLLHLRRHRRRVHGPDIRQRRHEPPPPAGHRRHPALLLGGRQLGAHAVYLRGAGAVGVYAQYEKTVWLSLSQNRRCRSAPVFYFTDKSPLSSNNLLLLYSFDDLDVLEAPLYYDYPIHFKNQAVYLYITSFPMIPFQIPYIILSLLISFSFYLIILQSFIRKRIQSIQNLQEDVFTLAIGDWNHEIKVSDKDEIGRLAQDLNQMRIALLQTMDNEQQARVVNKELISSLSHDLRTPLTTLKGYLEIMNLKKDDIKFRDQYLQKCLDKVEEITYLSNKMFEYSLVFSTEYNSDLSNIPVQKCIDTLVDHIQYLREMDLHILYEPLQTSLSMDANFAIIQRILNNVFSNIQKYCDPWKDIVIQTMIEEDQLKMSFTNSINHHLDKVESNGIGLKSVKKMIKIHHGTFYQDETNDLFTIILTFPIHQ